MSVRSDTRAPVGSSVSRTPEPTAPQRARTKPKRLGRITPYIFLAPAVLLLVVMGIYPIVYGLVLSFVNWNGINPHWEWVGVSNYANLLGADPRTAPLVLHALQNTVLMLVIVPIVVVFVGLILAFAVFSVGGRLGAMLRGLFFVPYVTAGIAVLYAWRFLLLPNGGINGALNFFGLSTLAQPNGFLGNANTALGSIIAVMIWLLIPFAMLVYLSSLESLDPEIIEAARIDGASSWSLLRRIIWPLMRPATLLIVIICGREALQDFQIILLMTHGGPLDSTNNLSFLAYNFAFSSNAKYGYASALGWLLFIGGLLVAGTSSRVLGRQERTPRRRRAQ